MEQKGFTFIELLMVIVLIALLSCYSVTTYHNLEDNRLKQTTIQIQEAIGVAQKMAYLTGRSYKIYCTRNKLYLYEGYKNCLYKLPIHTNMYIAQNSTGKEMIFNGSFAPSRAGTIQLIHKGLAKKMRITVRVATGKTTAYLENL